MSKVSVKSDADFPLLKHQLLPLLQNVAMQLNREKLDQVDGVLRQPL